MRTFIAIALAWLLAIAGPSSAQMTLTGAGSVSAPHAATITDWCSKIPQSGLVNCWPFDTASTTSSVATDLIGGNNATLTSVTLAGSGPSSNLNNAGVFNGTTSIGPTTLANLPLSAFTLVMWVNTPTLAGNPVAIANDHADSDNKGFATIINATPFMFLGNGTSTAFARASFSLATLTWAMLTWTYDGTTLTGYQDAAVGTTATLTGPVASGTNNVTFGYNPSYGGDFYAGNIAGVAVYNRALSPTEITTINGL